MRYPERIVCLTEETTETLYLLGQGHRIVGVSGYTVRPPEARTKPRVSAFINANFDKIETLRKQIGYFEEQVAGLTVRAPHAGTVVGSDPMNVVGAYARKGDALCEVVDTKRVRITAALTTAEAAPLIEVGWRPPSDTDTAPGFGVEMRAISDPATTLHAASAVVLEAGQKELPHAANSGDIYAALA